MPGQWDVVILGGGFAGLACAKRLEKLWGAAAARRVLLVSSENYFVFNALLPEVVGGEVEPWHVISPIRLLLRRCRVLRAEVLAVDLQRRRVEFECTGRSEAASSHCSPNDRCTMQAVDYARELVSRASPSRVSNRDVSDYVERVLRSLDFETERVEYDDECGVRKVNVIGRKGRGRGGLAFFGHTDTVAADDWAEGDPFTPAVRDGRLYGRGSCDMKGPVACMLAAAARFRPADLKQPLYIVSTADEEVGYRGATEVVGRSEMFQEIKSARGIIGEPTRLEVVYAHKGVIGFTATARGRAAHSSTGLGLNANLAMIPFLAEMRRIHDELQTDPKHRNEEFDPPTPGWNIGVNDFNTPVNVTAPRSVATVYCRTMPGTDVDGIAERVRRAAREHGLDLEVVGTGRPMYTDPNSEFVRAVLAVAGRPKPHTVPYGTDGLAFSPHLPLVVCGPGDIAQAHTVEEWIALEQLDSGTELYRKLIERFCQ
jgi:acetylornithine deacetylase